MFETSLPIHATYVDNRTMLWRGSAGGGRGHGAELNESHHSNTAPPTSLNSLDLLIPLRPSNNSSNSVASSPSECSSSSLARYSNKVLERIKVFGRLLGPNPSQCFKQLNSSSKSRIKLLKLILRAPLLKPLKLFKHIVRVVQMGPGGKNCLNVVQCLFCGEYAEQFK